jgi:hypothetical protein
VVSFKPRSLITGEKGPGTHFVGNLLDLRLDLDAVAKKGNSYPWLE